MRKLSVFLFIVIGLMAAMTVWFWPNIYGQYRFSQYCDKDGGLKIYGEVLPDQGWLAASNDPDDYKRPFSLKRIAFVRYQDKKGERYDVYIKTNPWPKDPDYIFEPVNDAKKVKYILKYSLVDVPNELRLNKKSLEIYSIEEKRNLVELVWFGYSGFDRDRTILGAPSGAQCPDDDSGTKFYNILKSN